MKFDHMAMDVSQTPSPDLLPVWCSTRCSNSLSNSIVKAIRAWESAVSSDGLGDDAREAIRKPYAQRIPALVRPISTRSGKLRRGERQRPVAIDRHGGALPPL